MSGEGYALSSASRYWGHLFAGCLCFSDDIVLDPSGHSPPLTYMPSIIHFVYNLATLSTATVTVSREFRL